MNAKRILLIGCLVAVAGSSATAQTFGFELTGKDRRPGPIPLGMVGTPVTIELWAWFDLAPGVELFGSANFDIESVEDGWLTSNVVLNGPGSSQGNFGSHALTSMVAAQVHIPSAGVFGDPSNPIMLWTGTWTTNSGPARHIDIYTSNTSSFWVFDQQGNTTQLYQGSMKHGHIAVSKYPTPSTSATLGVAVFIAMRRRRV